MPCNENMKKDSLIGRMELMSTDNFLAKVEDSIPTKAKVPVNYFLMILLSQPVSPGVYP
jgi:hypothetical protein